MQTIGRFIRYWSSSLEHAGVDAPRLSAEVLTAKALGLTRLEVLLRQQCKLESCAVQKAEALLRRRRKNEPLAYILQEKEFYGLVFQVSRDVLIPRPETEQVIEVAKGYFSVPKIPFVFADVCTGSGVIGITLASIFSGSCGILSDISEKALAVTRQNVRLHGLENRLQCVRSDFASAFGTDFLDLLVANPPYIAEQELSSLDGGVREYEPHQALFSGEKGLQAAETLVSQAWRVLKNGGRLIMELGMDQPARLQRSLAARAGLWEEPVVFQDLSHRDRILAIRKTVF